MSRVTKLTRIKSVCPQVPCRLFASTAALSKILAHCRRQAQLNHLLRWNICRANWFLTVGTPGTTRMTPRGRYSRVRYQIRWRRIRPNRDQTDLWVNLMKGLKCIPNALGLPYAIKITLICYLIFPRVARFQSTLSHRNIFSYQSSYSQITHKWRAYLQKQTSTFFTQIQLNRLLIGEGGVYKIHKTWFKNELHLQNQKLTSHLRAVMYI